MRSYGALAALYGLVPTFEPGQLVRHRRYGYRGVVVQVDDECRAPDHWYRSNRTQPQREQPWCHVLVDGSTQTTYAAAENLEIEPHARPVTHPLVPRFFSDFDEGRYVRNEERWPDWRGQR